MEEAAAAVAAGFAGVIGFMEIDGLEPFQHLLECPPPAIRANEQSWSNLEEIERVAAAKAANERSR